MKPTREDYNEAMLALHRFSIARADFDERASQIIGTPEEMLSSALNLLSYTAGMFAAAESTHYTMAAFRAALQTVRNATPAFSFVPTSREVRAVQNAAPKPGNSADQRAATRQAILFGLSDREGNFYGSPSRRNNILKYSAQA